MKKVLVVDDAMFMRKAISRILIKNGYDVIGEAGDGVEAIEKILLLKPDIVTLDITMPKMDGLETLKLLDEKKVNVKVCMVTAMGQESNIIEAIRLGATDFIIKPFDESRVLSALGKCK